jgi:hypothetical protein
MEEYPLRNRSTCVGLCHSKNDLSAKIGCSHYLNASQVISFTPSTSELTPLLWGSAAELSRAPRKFQSLVCRPTRREGERNTVTTDTDSEISKAANRSC